MTAEVLNIAGRRIKVLAADKAMAAGVNTLSWQGRSAIGTAAPSGVYLVRLRAAGEKGEQSQALAQVRILR